MAKRGAVSFSMANTALISAASVPMPNVLLARDLHPGNRIHSLAQRVGLVQRYKKATIDSKLIDQLGGSGRVAELLRIEHSETVMNWRRRGIPWRWRPSIAHLAVDAGIDLPSGFLDPHRR
jgi:hypothetical protein